VAELPTQRALVLLFEIPSEDMYPLVAWLRDDEHGARDCAHICSVWLVRQAVLLIQWWFAVI
jgi:hypothetical protein